MQPTKVMTWNIQHGGSSRMKGIFERIQYHSPDVLVLTEYRVHRIAKQLCENLKELGLAYQASSKIEAKQNGVLIAARNSFEQIPIPLDHPEASQRLLEVRFEHFGMTGVYMPLGREKKPFWEYLVSSVKDRENHRHIIIGDVNTGLHYLDENEATLYFPEYITQLAELGWHDAWRYQNPKARDATWISQKGNPFRLDHAFLSPALLPFLDNSWLSHKEREKKQNLSDHSAYLLTLNGNSNSVN